jgi:hypothetical protein
VLFVVVVAGQRLLRLGGREEQAPVGLMIERSVNSRAAVSPGPYEPCRDWKCKSAFGAFDTARESE